jgi:predicted GIY-YIG superfamily endonuclease
LDQQFWVYMVRCSDGNIYVGHTDNLEARITAHNLGTFKGYTYTRRPVTLIYGEVFGTREEAFHAERQVKGWTRAKKLALVAGDWQSVRRLGLRRTAPTAKPKRHWRLPEF